MPPPVARFRRVLTCVALLALVLAGGAFADNGGVAPPSSASPSEQHIRDIYWLILAITGGIFVLVTSTLIIFMVRYRSRGRPREDEGPQVRGHTNLELAWTAGPVIILAVIAGFVFWKASNFSDTSGAAAARARTEITVEGHQYYWEFLYPNGAISVDRLRLPYNQAVRLRIVSADVDHSWWVPALGGKLDAIPGHPNHTTLRATKLGTFRGQCAEFCGLLHAQMLAAAEVLPPDAYESWVRNRVTDAAALGEETFNGVCAKCHGLAGQGDIGPNLAQSATINDSKALANIIRNGGVKMPAVGKDWPQRQLDATIGYLQKRFGKGGGGGGQG